MKPSKRKQSKKSVAQNGTPGPTKIKNVGAQGDVLFLRLGDIGANEIPKSAVRVPPTNGRHVVAHSETGHHHVVDAMGTEMYSDPADPFTCYLRMETVQHFDVIHLREFDTHAPERFDHGADGVIVVRRQREYTPAGHRMVQD